MKIKTKQKLNLPELIQYVWENDIESTGFLSNEELPDGKNVRVHVNPRDVAGGRCAGVSVDSGEFVVDDSYTFTVKVEEELTEETKIQGATFVYYDEQSREVKPFRYADVTSPSLKHIIQLRPGTVALAVFRGKQLIWTKEHGIPESGVLEVSE